MAKVVLLILDGWGIAQDPATSAIAQGNTPFYDAALQQYPHTTLQASEEAVGLPKGQMGNSEVGHMNLGAGRVVFQELERIAQAIRGGELRKLPVFQALVAHCKQGHALHLMGLLSDGGVHSHNSHLIGLLEALREEGVKSQVFIHAFLDGRDTAPTSALDYLQELQTQLQRLGIGQLATVIGRYYAMDRDQRWERIQQAYNLLVHGMGASTTDALAAVQASYEAGITDEFVQPVVLQAHGRPVATLQPQDAVLFFNFRTDRGRQLTEALTQQEHTSYGMTPLPLLFVTLTRYDDAYQDVQVLFEKDNLTHTLGEQLAAAGLRQLRVAETEKYPHVTYFFNGGNEEPFAGEERLLIPSPKVATYDLQPEMAAYELRDAVIPQLEQEWAHFVCINLANPDMVGHTGNWQAVLRAVQVVDECAAAVAKACLAHGYTLLVLADHGNADQMRYSDGSPHTAHTLAPVPLILIAAGAAKYQLMPGKLGDVAPTILHLMGLPIPAAMTGKVLVRALDAA